VRRTRHVTDWTTDEPENANAGVMFAAYATIGQDAEAFAICLCEHEDHFGADAAACGGDTAPAPPHLYQDRLAGTGKAMRVGRVCETCANGQMAEYMLPAPPAATAGTGTSRHARISIMTTYALAVADRPGRTVRRPHAARAAWR
jgi:hypothetical protein